MRKVLFGVIITLLILLFFQFWLYENHKKETVLQGSLLIQEQVQNVGKLIVTEGYFSEVYNYKDQQTYLGELISFEKKALAVINAKVIISYNLEGLKYELDEQNKILHIKSIPEKEIDIDPTITFYDIDQSLFNPFTGDDYNKIQEKVREALMKKIKGASIVSNADNRLLSELSKFYILTNSLGWTLKMESREIKKLEDLSRDQFVN